ncbi:MAG: glycoside hydrolase [Bacteroidales bacterium]|nr:glycoside hydrolase [Bacteroidales bacterium]MCF8404889.1 glycoside hydrolase [Bacteroidales bacterium]
MKKLQKLLVIVLLLGSGITLAQVTTESTNGQKSTQEIRYEIDNIHYWVELAEKGLVPFNQPIPFSPAVEKGSQIVTPDYITNSPDVVILDISGNTQSENSVFIDPNDNSHVFNSNNSEQSGSIYGANYVFSDDYGLTWTGSKYGAGGSNSGDPAACIGLNGRSFDGFIYNRGQAVAYSDNGTSWTRVVVGADPGTGDLLDKNHLWIDNTNSSQEGNIYDAWTRFDAGHANDNEIEFSRSTNNGVSWSTPYEISSGVSAGNHNQGVNIQCNNTGWVFATWVIYDDWGTGVYEEDAIGFARSPNGGSSFYSASRIHNNINGIRGWVPTNATGKNLRVNSFPSMTIDVSGGTYHGNIYIVWANNGVPGVNTGTNVSVYCMKSTSGGTTWNTPVRVNTSAAADHCAFFPWITCDPITGNLYCIFYDDRNFSTTSGELETWLAYSNDGGATWNDFRVSDVSFTPSPIPGLASGYMGDYLGVAARDGWVYPTWTDNRSGRALTYVSPLNFGGNCIATGGNCYEYIDNVTVGTINNSSSCNGYEDFRDQSTNLSLSGNLSITVSNATSAYSQDQCGIWVDWNRDGDFYDANETIAVTGTPGTGPYTATISPPAGTTAGECTLRTRITYTGVVDPCGTTTFGEVEDYTLNITATPGLWTGNISSDWHTNGNWDDGVVPGSSTNVTIPGGTPYQPTIGPGTYAYCNNLSIQTGATLTQNGSTANYFYVYGNFNSDYGTFTQTGIAYLYFDGASDTYWDDDNMDDTYEYVRVLKDNPSNTLSMWQHMTVNQTFHIREGIFAYSSTWTLTVNGLGTDAFQVEAGGVLNLANSQTINCAGDIQFLDGSQANVTGGTIYCGDEFRFLANTAYDIQFTGGTVIMTGGLAQYIEDWDGNSEFYNLTINKSGGICALNYGDLDVNGNLTISGGTLNPNSYDIYAAGNWTNSVGDAGFDQSTGRVIFNGGNYHQYCSNEIFNELEVNKALGGALRMNGTNVECAAYDWTAGAVDVLTGSFTANDLLDNAVAGAFYNNTGGTINLTNSGTGLYVDLNGELHNFGGTINISGSISYWPYTNNAVVEMTDGVIDITDCGIYINNSASYTLTEMITGGVIRTAGGFSGNRADFTPSYGIFEFYGPNDVTIAESNGCTINNVEINKSNSDAGIKTKNFEIDGQRVDKTIIQNSEANTVSLLTTFLATGYFNINAGSFNLNGHQLDVPNHDINISGNLIMTQPADVINAGSEIMWLSGATENVTNGEFNVDYRVVFQSGSNVQLGTGNDLNFIGTGTTAIRNFSPVAEIGNLNIDMPPSSGNFYISYTTTEPVHVAGNLNVEPGNILNIQEYDLIVEGVMDIKNTAICYLGSVLGSGYLENNSDFTLNGEIYVDYDAKDNSNDNLKLTEDVSVGETENMDWQPGEVWLHGMYQQASTAAVHILGGGSYICDAPTTTISTIYGLLELNDGLFEITNNHLKILGSTSINGGIIRSGGSFIATASGNFQPTAGSVELIGTGGTGQYIQMDAANYFYDLLIDRTNMIQIYTTNDLHIQNDFTINSGGLNSNQKDIYLGGDWTNNVSPAAFNESTGTVIFNGTGVEMQFVNGSEEFNNITNNSNTAIRVNASADVVSCDSYYWISGAVSVSLGTFIAYDLAQSGLYGSWYSLTSAEIHLYQDAGQYVDVFGNIYINGGLIKVYGGADESYWCGTNPLSLDLLGGGTLDFVDWGITIWNNQALTENIVDGTIRTGGHFSCYRNDFNPTAGVVEFYGGNDAYIDMYAGNSFNDVNINKSGGDESVIIYKNRKGQTITDNKSNTVFLGNDLEVNGLFDLNDGSFMVDGNTMNCYSDVNVNGGTLYVNDNSSLQMDNNTGLYVNAGGMLNAVGSSGIEPTISNISTGNYKLWIENGGYIGAEYATFEYMALSGVYLRPGSFVDLSYPFNNCIFRNGQSGGSLLTIYNTQTFQVTDAIFPISATGSSYNVFKNVTSGDVTFYDASGGFSGAAYEFDPYDKVHWDFAPITFNLVVFMEGPFDPGTGKMRTDINSLLPTGQPFSPSLPYYGNPMPDWYYAGTESVGAIPSPFIVDWVLVEFRDATSPANAVPATSVAIVPAFLLNNGDVVALDGSGPLTLSAGFTNDIYVVIWNRNHLGVISANPVVEIGGVFPYDFTTASSQAWGGTSAQKDLGGGTWGMISGDGNGDGTINIPDEISVWTSWAGLMYGYSPADYNYDMQINNKDKNDKWQPNIGAGSFIPE